MQHRQTVSDEGRGEVSTNVEDAERGNGITVCGCLDELDIDLTLRPSTAGVIAAALALVVVRVGRATAASRYVSIVLIEVGDAVAEVVPVALVLAVAITVSVRVGVGFAIVAHLEYFEEYLEGYVRC